MTTIDETPWPGPAELDDQCKQFLMPQTMNVTPGFAPAPGSPFYEDGKLIGIVLKTEYNMFHSPVVTVRLTS